MIRHARSQASSARSYPCPRSMGYGLTPDEVAIVEGWEAGGKKAATAAKPVKTEAGAKKFRKSVMTEDPDLA